MYEKTLDLFEEISLDPNEFILTMILNACARLSNDRSKQIGKKLLKKILKDNEISNYVINSVIYMLMKFGDVKSAEDFFRLIKKKDIVTYGAMMKGTF